MTPEEIKDIIIENTEGLFDKACYVFKNQYDFESSGVSDRYINMVYIRPLVIGSNKYKVREIDGVTKVTAKYRIVVQILKKYDNVVNTFLNILTTIPDIELTGYSDDTDGVYQDEYKREVTLRDHDLYLFDIEVTSDLSFSDIICECITDKSC